MSQKKSFLMYLDNEVMFTEMSNEQVGIITRALFAYACRGERYRGSDPIVKLATNVLFNTIDRDNKKYDARCKKNAKAASDRWGKGKGGNSEEPKLNANECNRMQSYANYADRDSDIDSDIDIDIDIDRKKDIDKESESHIDMYRDSPRVGDIRHFDDGSMQEYTEDGGWALIM